MGITTKIKICGLTRLEDVNYVNLFNPDFVGFVFAPGRHRIDIGLVAELRRNLNRSILPVGVFVNEEIDIICGLLYDEVIDIIQLHGDEDEEYVGRLKDQIQDMYYGDREREYRIIKAVRVRDEEDLRQADRYPVDYLLLDSYSEGVYGGSGRCFDRRILQNVSLTKPYFLAGGLEADNIGEALSECEPYCIDLSSGVETDGVKDLRKISDVIRAVRGGTENERKI